MVVPSIQQVGWPFRQPEGTPVVWCVGGADDHLRLVVLLAQAFVDQGAREQVAACMRRSAPWRERLGALESILDGLPEPADGGHLLCVVDPDALDVLPRDGDEGEFWDDATARRERAEVLDVLLRRATRGGVLFVRPFPRPSLSARMLALDLRSQGDAPLASSLRWLGTVGGLGKQRLAELADDPAAAFDAVLDALPPASLQTAAAIAPIRTSLHVNGTCGPLPWGPGGLDRERFHELAAAGVLLPTDRPGEWAVSRPARQCVEARPAETAARTHRLLARASGGDLAQRLEVHHHAVAAGLVQRAVETAEFYGSDLRSAARSLSLRGEYREAAVLFQKIVEEFDATDAYAWEYLGYNLARSSEAPSDQTVARVGDAYRKAHALAPTNPLYHGRLFGHLLLHGAALLQDADRPCASYRALAGARAKDMFGWQIVRALRRARRDEEAKAFTARWGITEPARERPPRWSYGCAKGLVAMADDFDAPVDGFEDP